jgi:hypothetical protein
MVGHPSITFLRTLDSAPNLASEKVMEGCAVTQALSTFRWAKLSSDTQMPLAVGEKLGLYEILAPIGAGGMGGVDKARDTKLEREAKVLASLKSSEHRADIWHRRY